MNSCGGWLEKIEMLLQEEGGTRWRPVDNGLWDSRNLPS